MRLIALGLLAGFLVCGSAAADTAASQPPSAASIKDMLQVMHAQQTVDAMQAQVDGMLRKSTEQALQGRPVDAGEQKILDGQTSRISALMKNQLSWNVMEPIYVDIYTKNFTQKEVDDTIAFYKTPSGQAMMAKMPVVMGQAMQIAQSKIASMVPQLRQISEDTASQLKAYEASKQKAAPTAVK